MGYFPDVTTKTTPLRATPVATPEAPAVPASAAPAPGMAQDVAADMFAPPPPLTVAQVADKVRALTAKMQGLAAEPAEVPGVPAAGRDFGHTTGIAITSGNRQPFWKDDRSKITPEQWVQMPQAQQDAILGMIGDEGSRKMFEAGVDPDMIKSRAAIKSLAGAAGRGFLKLLAASEERAARLQQPPKP